jgi:hypothetical protein
MAKPATQVVNLEWRGQPLELRLPARLSERQRERLLVAMMELGGVSAACKETGITLGMALGERLRNPQFRRGWEKAQRERRALLETLLTDLVVRGLTPDGDRTPGASGAQGEAREKFLASLAQALGGIGAEPAKRGRQAAALPRAAASRGAPAQPSHPAAPDEMLALLAEVERKIAGAEAGQNQHSSPAISAALNSPEC